MESLLKKYSFRFKKFTLRDNKIIIIIILNEIKKKLNFHLVVPSARLELALQKGTDFKSVVSTNFTTRALINFIVCMLTFII